MDPTGTVSYVLQTRNLAVKRLWRAPKYYTFSSFLPSSVARQPRTHSPPSGLCLQAPLSHFPLPRSINQSGSFLSTQDFHFPQAPKNYSDMGWSIASRSNCPETTSERTNILF
ncbi:hypothetical protein TNCV_586651 [Trichonephila clavipes]|nr:hypothetical protein TNCV_586651 [Trichonephila clavipes]